MYQWITLDDGRQVYRKQSVRTNVARSALPTPMFIRDDMPETEHPCTGQTLTSKSAFRAITKAHECVEVGNDQARFRTPPKPQIDRKVIRASLEKAKARLNA